MCGIKPGGAVVCWGFVRAHLGEDYAKRSSGEVAGLDGVTALGLGDGYACALRGAGEIWCFGKGERGELGGEPSVVTVAPRQVMLPRPATSLSVGPETACAQLVDGRWYCWGANQHGEISSERTPVLTPTALDLSRVDMAG